MSNDFSHPKLSNSMLSKCSASFSEWRWENSADWCSNLFLCNLYLCSTPSHTSEQQVYTPHLVGGAPSHLA